MELEEGLFSSFLLGSSFKPAALTSGHSILKLGSTGTDVRESLTSKGSIQYHFLFLIALYK